MSSQAPGGHEASTAMGAVVVVPVKGFAHAKKRLASVLGPRERALLARKMATQVLAAARPLPVVVVCDDPDVEQWAVDQAARAVVEPGAGLNGAVDMACSQLQREGYGRVVVAHGDLPFATSLEWLAHVEGIVIIPDRRDEGTNVISLPSGCGFRFRYGPGSFTRHCEEAERTGLPWQVVRDAGLAWDIDLPADIVGAPF